MSTIGHRTKEYQEGYAAAERREDFSTHCPYTFDKTGLKHGWNGHRDFDRDYRPKMDAWFAGWKAWLTERGLGNDFEPTRNKKENNPVIEGKA